MGSPAAFFERYGFVLLNKPTKVKKWNMNWVKTGTDIDQIYHGEVDEMLKEEIWPEHKDDIHKIKHSLGCLRRGPGS